MLVKTSYFYQIRFFDPWQLPLSTAMWDPKWYHENKGNAHIYLDKRGVVNGLRINVLTPPRHTEGLCYGREKCAEDGPDSCDFLRVYMEHLRQIDFSDFMYQLERNCQKVCSMYEIYRFPEAILIFHEKPDNPCSERVAVTQWFKENGVEISEYSQWDT